MQRYFCYACGRSFTGGQKLDISELWALYTQGKQTYKNLSESFNVSESTIKRRLSQVKVYPK